MGTMRIARPFYSALVLSILGLSAPTLAQPVATASAKSCPTNPDELGAMIDELKGTFECSGLNLRECNEYRAGLIGGGVAASVAAGIGAYKARPGLMACLMPGRTVSSLNSILKDEAEGRPVWAMLALGFFGPMAESAPSSCRFPTKELGKEFRDMSDEHFRESKAIRGEMLDRIMAQKAPDALKKIEVSDAEVRKQFVDGLDQLERQVRADTTGKLAVHKQWMLDDIAKLKAQYRTAGGYADMVADFGKFSANFNLQGKTEFIDAETLKKLRVWDMRDTIRAEKIANLSDPALKAAYQKALLELDTFADMSQMSGKAAYLKGLGYSPDFVERMVSAEGVRRNLQLRGSLLQGAAHDLNYGQLKGKAFLDQKELAQFARQRSLQFFDHPITRWGHMPGINNGVVQSVAKAGRAAMAKISSVAAGDLAGMAKYGLKGIGFVGSKAFAAVSETAFHMGDVHCGGGNPGQFVTIAYDSDKERCAASNERSDLTDAFLFGLSRDEQLKEIQQTNGTCEMLMGLHARYSPSQNWNLSCEGGEATLSGIGEDGSGQMIKFNTEGGMPNDVRWFSDDFDACAKVSFKEDQVEYADVYKYDSGGVCGGGQAIRMTEGAALSRAATRNQRQLMRQFSNWQKHNSFAMASAVGCCQGESTGFCPEGLSSGGPSKVRTNRSRGTTK